MRAAFRYFASSRLRFKRSSPFCGQPSSSASRLHLCFVLIIMLLLTSFTFHKTVSVLHISNLYLDLFWVSVSIVIIVFSGHVHGRAWFLFVMSPSHESSAAPGCIWYFSLSAWRALVLLWMVRRFILFSSARSDWSSPQLVSPHWHPAPQRICAHSAWSFIQLKGSTA